MIVSFQTPFTGEQLCRITATCIIIALCACSFSSCDAAPRMNDTDVGVRSMESSRFEYRPASEPGLKSMIHR